MSKKIPFSVYKLTGSNVHMVYYRLGIKISPALAMDEANRINKMMEEKGSWLERNDVKRLTNIGRHKDSCISRRDRLTAYDCGLAKVIETKINNYLVKTTGSC